MMAVFDLSVFILVSKCYFFFPNVSSKCFLILFSCEVGDVLFLACCLEL